MRLKKLSLTYFQDHYKSEVHFGPTFTCIVGPTNSGKSSIVRALSFLLYGDWIEDYVAHGTTHCVLTAEYDNGVQITRIKGSGKNSLTLTKGEEVHHFDKIGITLPSEFYNWIQLSPATFDVDVELCLNIANQDDPYFLLMEPGPVKTKVLGKLAGLHVADAALRGLSTDRKNLSTEKNHLKGQIEELSNQLKPFAKLQEFQGQIDELNKALYDVEQLETKLQELKKLRTALATLTEKLRTLQLLKGNAVLPSISPLTGLDSHIRALKEKRQSLQQITKTLKDLVFMDAEYRLEHQCALDEYQELWAQFPQCPLCGAAK